MTGIHDPFKIAREYEQEHPDMICCVGHWGDKPPANWETATVVARVRVHPHDPDIRIWGMPRVEAARLAAAMLGKSGGLKGGLSTSPAKQEAVRANGRKGGRPRKQA